MLTYYLAFAVDFWASYKTKLSVMQAKLGKITFFCKKINLFYKLQK